MVCQKLCQNSGSGWGSLEESCFYLYLHLYLDLYLYIYIEIYHINTIIPEILFIFAAFHVHVWNQPPRPPRSSRH